MDPALRFVEFLHDTFGTQPFTPQKLLREPALAAQEAKAASLPRMRWSLQIEGLMRGLAGRHFTVASGTLTIESVGSRHAPRWQLRKDA